MRRMILTTTALVGLSASLVQADSLADSIVQALQTQGYTSIEVLIGPTQLKVEAYQPGSKVEQVLDLATGAVLKSETKALDDDEDDDFSPGVEVEDVAQDFIDGNGKPISDDEAYNDPLANEVTAALLAQGFTQIETLIGPTQIRTRAVNDSGLMVEIIYDHATGAVLLETVIQGDPEDDDFHPGTLIEDVGFDFLDSDGNPITPEDEEDEEDQEEEDDEEEDDAEQEEDEDEDDGDGEEEDEDEEDDDASDDDHGEGDDDA